MVNDGLSVVTVPTVQLHTPAAQTEHLKMEVGGEDEKGRWEGKVGREGGRGR